jgi:hypothetical protein
VQKENSNFGLWEVIVLGMDGAKKKSSSKVFGGHEQNRL